MGQGGKRVGESCEGWAEKKDRGRDVGFLKASNKLETQTNTEDFWRCSTLASFFGFLII